MDLPFILNQTRGDPNYLVNNAPAAVPYFVLLIVATVTGTIGNTLIIGAVCVHKPLRKVGSFFIVNLAIADMCVTTFVDPFNIVSVLRGEAWFLYSPGLCEFIADLCLTACFASLYSIGMVSFNRYVAIVHHERYPRIFTPAKAGLMCVGIWVLSFLLELPNITGWGGHGYDPKTLTCLWDRTASYEYTLFVVICGISIPLVVISICYVLIFLHVRASKRRILAMAMATASTTVAKKTTGSGQDTKLARTLFIIFVVFATCWAPYALIIVLDRWDTYPQEAHMYLILIAHVNSSLNCLLYGGTNTHFRQGYLKLVGLDKCCAKRMRNMQSDTSQADHSKTMATQMA